VKTADSSLSPAGLASDGALEQLGAGPVHWFADWPVTLVPRTGAIVYTIWDRAGAFLYVGMAGRGTSISANSKGPFGRLESHANGRRSGDQFNVYVSDRLVLLRVHNRIDEIARGELSLDRLTREFIRAELGFRFNAAPDAASAYALERQLQRGEWDHGRPLLNPAPGSKRSAPHDGVEPELIRSPRAHVGRYPDIDELE
jgi:hypothetical protein